MANKKKDVEKELKDSANELKNKSLKGYEKLIDRLERESQNIRNEVDSEYREARRYVRSNPEEGVLIALVGGMAIGLLLGRLSK